LIKINFYINILPSGREAVSPLENIITLRHAPIINSNNIDGSINDLKLFNPMIPPEDIITTQSATSNEFSFR